MRRMQSRIAIALAALLSCAVVMGPLPAAAADLIAYQIDVRTCNLDGAGTDSDVWVRVQGSNYSSAWVELENGTDELERGQIDTFWYYASPALGTLRYVQVYFSPAGNYSDWCLSWIRVTGDGQSPLFRYNGSYVWFTSTGYKTLLPV